MKFVNLILILTLILMAVIWEHIDACHLQDTNGSMSKIYQIGDPGAPNCSMEFPKEPTENCTLKNNHFVINSSMYDDDDEIIVNCSALYPINLKFDGIFYSNPSLQIEFGRRLIQGKQLFLLNFTISAELTSTGDYLVYSAYDLAVKTNIAMEFTPKHGQKTLSQDLPSIIDHYNEISQRPTLTNSSDILTLNITEKKKNYVVCVSEFENNIQRLTNVYARNPTEANYKSECVYKNSRCFSKREGSLVKCGVYGFHNYTCRALDLKPRGGFVGCFTEGYDVNYSIIKRYFIGVDDKIHFKEEGADQAHINCSKLIRMTVPNHWELWSENAYEFSCKISTYLLAKAITWHMVDYNSSWTQLHNDRWHEDAEKFLISKINVTLSSNVKQIVCTGYYYNSSTMYNITADVKITESFIQINGTTGDRSSGFLECSACGGPPPNFIWTIDGENYNATVVKTGGNCKTVWPSNYSNTTAAALSDASCTAWNSKNNVTQPVNFVARKDDILWIVIGVLTALTVIGCILFFLVYLRFKRKLAYLTRAEIEEFRKGSKIRRENSMNPNAILEVLPYKEEYEIDETKLTMDDTNPENIIGEGAFGVVIKGVYDGKDVAIKTLKTFFSKADIQNLLSELKIMQYVGEHNYIAKLVGALTNNLRLGKIFVLMEMCPLGSLDNFLKNMSIKRALVTEYVNLPEGYCCTVGGLDENDLTISTSDLINWSRQIAEGMAYLTEISVIHGDLATRNILLADMNTVKIADFGLSRKQYQLYVKKNADELVPWKWMAPESLRFRIYTVETDIWSYGVTLWEIFSLAEDPYPGTNLSESFLENLSLGNRLGQPSYASPELYEIMLQCWLEDPKKRIKFQKIEQILRAMYDNIIAYPDVTSTNL